MEGWRRALYPLESAKWVLVMIESAEEFIRLRGSSDRVEYERAAHDQAPDSVWMDVIHRFPEYRFWVAHNKTVPVSILQVLATDSDERVRGMVARKGKLPPELVAFLAQDSSESVRAVTARHGKASREVLSVLAHDPSPVVREIAMQRITELVRLSIFADLGPGCLRRGWLSSCGQGCGGDVAVGGDAEADRFGAACCGRVGLGDFVVGGGEADFESFGFAGPAFAFGFGDAGLEVVADVLEAVALGGVDAKHGAADAALSGQVGSCEQTTKNEHLKTPDGQVAMVVGGSAPADHDGWMWDLTVPGNNDHDFYVAAGSTAVLVHNCPTDDGPPSEDTIHSTLRGGAGERNIESGEVIKNAENIYYDENGNQVYRLSQPGGTSQIVIRNPANGNILTNQSSTDTWIEQQIKSGRWYDLQGG
jgi:hypothetical protein